MWKVSAFTLRLYTHCVVPTEPWKFFFLSYLYMVGALEFTCVRNLDAKHVSFGFKESVDSDSIESRVVRAEPTIKYSCGLVTARVE